METPTGNVHPIPTDGVTLDAAVTACKRELNEFYGAEELSAGRPLFDVTLLGLGADGHAASLFPGAPVLRERSRWVAQVVGFMPEARITLTCPALESSRDVAFLVTGAAKRQILGEYGQVRAMLPWRAWARSDGCTGSPIARPSPIPRDGHACSNEIRR